MTSRSAELSVCAPAPEDNLNPGHPDFQFTKTPSSRAQRNKRAAASGEQNITSAGDQIGCRRRLFFFRFLPPPLKCNFNVYFFEEAMDRYGVFRFTLSQWKPVCAHTREGTATFGPWSTFIMRYVLSGRVISGSSGERKERRNQQAQVPSRKTTK